MELWLCQVADTALWRINWYVVTYFFHFVHYNIPVPVYPHSLWILLCSYFAPPPHTEIYCRSGIQWTWVMVVWSWGVCESTERTTGPATILTPLLRVCRILRSSTNIVLGWLVLCICTLSQSLLYSLMRNCLFQAPVATCAVLAVLSLPSDVSR